MIFRRCFIVQHNTSAGESANTATTRIKSTFHATCTYAFIIWRAQAPVCNLFPFVHKPNTLDRDRIVVPAGWDSWSKISVMRNGFDTKMWGEAWERDLESGEQETSETGAKKAYATLVPDQGSEVNCSPFFTINLHLCSLCHCLHSIIPFQNKPSLPKIMMNIWRNQTEILEEHSKTLLTLSVQLLVLLGLWEAAVSIYPMLNVLWAKRKAESDLQIHLHYKKT